MDACVPRQGMASPFRDPYNQKCSPNLSMAQWDPWDPVTLQLLKHERGRHHSMDTCVPRQGMASPFRDPYNQKCSPNLSMAQWDPWDPVTPSKAEVRLRHFKSFQAGLSLDLNQMYSGLLYCFSHCTMYIHSSTFSSLAAWTWIIYWWLIWVLQC